MSIWDEEEVRKISSITLIVPAIKDIILHPLSLHKFLQPAHKNVSQVVVSKNTKKAVTLILAKHCIKIPDDGSLVVRNMLEQF